MAETDLFDAECGSESGANAGSVLERLWPAWKDGVLIERPSTRRFFELLRRAVEVRGEVPDRLSWRALATRPPRLGTSAGNAPTDDRDPENRRRELDRWRSGKIRAKPETLSRFLHNLGADEYQIFEILLLYRIAYGIGEEVQWMIEYPGGPSSKALRQLEEIFAAYPQYRVAARTHGAHLQGTG